MASGWWITDLLANDPPRLIAWVFWVIFSICVHELAHGWTAIKLGDRTPIELGHMTWNPLVHMGPMSLLMFAIVGIAWGAMPVTPSRLRGRYGDVLVSVAGPASNVLLAALSLVVGSLVSVYATGLDPQFHDNLITFFWVGCWLNLILAIFNMLPIPPLDGSRILAGFSYRYRELISHPNAPVIGLVAMFLLIWPAMDPVIGFAVAIANEGMGAIVSILP